VVVICPGSQVGTTRFGGSVTGAAVCDERHPDLSPAPSDRCPPDPWGGTRRPGEHASVAPRPAPHRL